MKEGRICRLKKYFNFLLFFLHQLNVIPLSSKNKKGKNSVTNLCSKLKLKQNILQRMSFIIIIKLLTFFQVTIKFENYGPGVRFIVFNHSGRDTQFWAGQYGSKMSGGVIRFSLPKPTGNWIFKGNRKVLTPIFIFNLYYINSFCSSYKMLPFCL